MADLLIKTSDGTYFNDGDVLAAKTDDDILIDNARLVVARLKERRNSDGYMSSGCLTEKVHQETRRYKTEVLTSNTVRVTDLTTSSSAVRSVPNLSTVIRKYKKITFGTSGHEVWYSGYLDWTSGMIDAVWNHVETMTPDRRANAVYYPFSLREITKHFAIRVDALSKAEAQRLVTPMNDGVRDIAQRMSKVAWRDLPELDDETRENIGLSFVPVDVRPFYTFISYDVVEYKGVGTMVNIQELAAEIENDPLSRGYVSMSNTEVAASLNAVNRTVTLPAVATSLSRWASKSGRYQQIFDLANNVAKTDEIRSAAWVVKNAIDSNTFQLDMSNADDEAMIDALISGGALDATDKAALIGDSTVTISRAEELGWTTVTAGHVAQARA